MLSDAFSPIYIYIYIYIYICVCVCVYVCVCVLSMCDPHPLLRGRGNKGGGRKGEAGI